MQVQGARVTGRGQGQWPGERVKVKGQWQGASGRIIGRGSGRGQGQYSLCLMVFGY